MESRTFASFKEAANYAADYAREHRAVVSLKQHASEWQVVIPGTGVESTATGKRAQTDEPEVGPQHTDNHYRFSVQRQTYRGAVFAENLEQEKTKVVDCVLEFFPTAAVEARIDLAAFDGDYNTYSRTYFIVVTFTDLSMSAEEFNENLRDLRRVLHV